MIDEKEIALYSKWSKPDLDCVCAQEEWELLTDSQAIEVFKLIERTHDAEIGINWEVIKQAIELIRERPKHL